LARCLCDDALVTWGRCPGTPSAGKSLGQAFCQGLGMCRFGASCQINLNGCLRIGLRLGCCWAPVLLRRPWDDQPVLSTAGHLPTHVHTRMPNHRCFGLFRGSVPAMLVVERRASFMNASGSACFQQTSPILLHGGGPVCAAIGAGCNRLPGHPALTCPRSFPPTPVPKAESAVPVACSSRMRWPPPGIAGTAPNKRVAGGCASRPGATLSMLHRVARASAAPRSRLIWHPLMIR
jgi:hypothetical protein